MAKEISSNLQKKFNLDVNGNNSDNCNYSVEENIFNNNIDFNLSSLDKVRWAMRIGTGIAIYSSYLLFPAFGPVGILAGRAGALISENIMNEKIERQRSEVKATVTQTINNVFSNVYSEIEKKTIKMYSEITKEIYQAKVSWLNEQRKYIDEEVDNLSIMKDMERIKHNLDAMDKIKTLINIKGGVLW